MRHTVIAVAVEHLVTEVGLWCNDCMLGAGVRVWVAATAQGQMVLNHAVGCTDCGGRNVT